MVRKAVLIALTAVAALVVLPFVTMFAFDTIATVAGGCSEGEMRVFREFPQYGGATTRTRVQRKHRLLRRLYDVRSA